MNKVLVVDDNPVNRVMLHNILKDYYDVVEAVSGREALDILMKDEGEILAVLLDLVMPEMDGFAVLKEIRNHAQLSGLPVIIQTENTEESFEKKHCRRVQLILYQNPINRILLGPDYRM